jgi:hypothetical protein
MRTIKVSDAVWNAIAERGKFGETEDDVLRRVFGTPPSTEEEKPGHRGRGAVRYAEKRMSARVESGKLVVEFEDGARHEWSLPHRDDKEAIRSVLDVALTFATDNGASNPGQTNAVRKALTDGGYHLTK